MVSVADINAYSKATTEIDKYTQALARAEKASASIEKSTDKATKSLKSQGSEASALKGKLPAVFDGAYKKTSSDLLGTKALLTSYDPPAPGKQSSLDNFKYELDASGQVYGGSAFKDEGKSDERNPILQGADAAFEDYKKKASDVAGLSKEVFKGTFESMEKGITNFVTTGKFSFSDFTRSVLADMAKIAAEKAAVGLLGTLLDVGVNMFASSPAPSGGNAAGYSPAVLGPWLAAQQAKGGIWNSGVQMYAKGGAFTNSIVSSPTTFGMAGGNTGLMGEAGPEAIIPLTRTSNGSLGVRAIGGFGGSGGASIQVNAPVSINTQDRGGDGMSLDQQALQQNLQKQMTAAAERAVADSWRAGGISYRNANGRA